MDPRLRALDLQDGSGVRMLDPQDVSRTEEHRLLLELIQFWKENLSYHNQAGDKQTQVFMFK